MQGPRNPLRSGARARLPLGAYQVVTSRKPGRQDPPANSNQSAENGEKKHEPLFEGWEKPRLALIITGQQRGYLEPCGCTGLTNQKGGMARRHSMIRSLENRDWEIMPLDAGNQVRRVGKQAELKFQFTQSALTEMKYVGATFGPEDLKLSAADLAATTSDIGDVPSPYCSANVSIFGLTAPYRVAKQAGVKVGITGVVSAEEAKALAKTQLDAMAPAEGLRQVVPKLQKEQCHLLVLLAHTSMDEAKELARQFPVFHLVIVTGNASEPAYKPELIKGLTTQFILTGDKGMYVGVVGLFNDQQTPFKYQRVPLDDRFPDSQMMLDNLEAYQKRLMREGLQGLGVKPIPHSSGHQFVGSGKCAECHDDAYDIWKDTSHAHGTDSLVNPPERRGLARHFDPECLSCHVTGWNPQKFYPYVSGYTDLEQSKHLHGVGCEDCHGPGSEHVAVESGEKQVAQDVRDALRKQMQLPLAKAQEQCVQCHDLDNSPEFKFDEYWPQVEH